MGCVGSKSAKNGPTASVLDNTDSTRGFRSSIAFKATSSTFHATSAISPFATLPDLCLLALFRQLPLKDQINARALCTRWSALIPVATRNCSRSLTLIIADGSRLEETKLTKYWSLGHRVILKHLKNPDNSPSFPITKLTAWNCLHFTQIDLSTVNQLVTAFPRVNKLQLAFHFSNTSPDSLLDCLCHLLTTWRHQLINLKIYDSLADTSALPSITKLVYFTNEEVNFFYSTLNCLSSLKYLTLRLGSLPHGDLSSIIGQLDQLVFQSTDPSSRQFAAMLGQHQGGNCRLDYSGHDFSQYDNALSDLVPFGRHLNRLSYYSRHIDLLSICTYFRHLTSLSFFSSDDTPAPNLRALLTALSQLTQLIHLKLQLVFQALLPDDQPSGTPLPQLPSVRAFELIVSKLTSHRQFKQLHLSWTMPNLEVFYFYLYMLENRCSQCKVEFIQIWIAPAFDTNGVYERRRLQNLERRQKCLDIIQNSLKQQSPKLQVIQERPYRSSYKWLG